MSADGRSGDGGRPQETEETKGTWRFISPLLPKVSSATTLYRDDIFSLEPGSHDVSVPPVP